MGIGKANSLAHHLNFTDAQVCIPNTVAAGSNPAVGFVVTPCLVNRRRIRYMSVVSQVHVGREWLLKARARSPQLNGECSLRGCSPPRPIRVANSERCANT